MMYSIGRAAIRRVGAGASHTTTKSRAIRNIWYLHRVDSSKSPNNTSDRSPSTSVLRRSFATASTATKKASPKSAKKPASKKPAAKKPASKTTVKKAAAKKPLKRKPVAKKPVLTPEKKEQIKAKKAILKAKGNLKELKEKSLLLSQPKIALRPTAWTSFFQDFTKSLDRSTAGFLKRAMPDAAAKYKELSPAEREQWNHKANQQRDINVAAFSQWVETHTPEQIREANNARNQLNKIRKANVKPIHDIRIPKRPSAPYNFFLVERWSSGDLKGLKVPEANKVVQEEFSKLPASQRKIYEDKGARDLERYYQEFRTVFNRDPPQVARSKAAKA